MRGALLVISPISLSIRSVVCVRTDYLYLFSAPKMWEGIYCQEVYALPAQISVPKPSSYDRLILVISILGIFCGTLSVIDIIVDFNLF